MKERSFSSPDYKHGFNGMEKDEELKGSGNSYDFGARIYDPRLGRFLNMDPLSGKYPNISPYVFAANSPILFIDNNGEEPFTAVIDAVTAFMVTAGLSYVENIVFKDMSAEDALNNKDWMGATTDAAISYGMSIFISGLGATKALGKLANSKTGRITASIVESVISNFAKRYNAGELFDKDGNLDYDKLQTASGDAIEDAIIGALISEGFAKKAKELKKKYKAAGEMQIKQEVKLKKNLKSKAEGKGATEKTVDNRQKK
jgi:RHS repeat-associated protein